MEVRQAEEEVRKSQLLRKIERSDSRKELVSARRVETIQLKSELDRTKSS
jgi:hypothetical protein